MSRVPWLPDRKREHEAVLPVDMRGPEESPILTNIDVATQQVQELLDNPNTFPALVGLTGTALTLYLASNKDVLKAIIRAVGNIPPDSLEADIL